MTNTSFPLFNQLSKKIQENPICPLNDVNKQTCIDTIKTMSSTEHELIFALIRFFQMEMNENTCYTLPYHSKHQKAGIKFDMDKLPYELQHILYEFVQLHIQSREQFVLN